MAPRRQSTDAKTTSHYVENGLLLLLAFFLPPCAVACVTGCDINFVLNLIFTVFGMWIAGVIHAIVMIVIFGFNEKELPRKRRAARLAAEREQPTAPPPQYKSRERKPLAPTYAPRGAEDVGGGGSYDLGAYARAGDEYGQSSGSAPRAGDGHGQSSGAYPGAADEYGQVYDEDGKNHRALGSWHRTGNRVNASGP